MGLYYSSMQLFVISVLADIKKSKIQESKLKYKYDKMGRLQIRYLGY